MFEYFVDFRLQSVVRCLPEHTIELRSFLTNTADWAYDTDDIPCSYAVELRDEGRYGFLLPESEIKPVEEEMFAAFKKMHSKRRSLIKIK